jgi:hypothetical protein
MKKNFRKYKCPFCSQTSSRRYNIDIHIQRKHPPPQTNNIIQPPIFNESYNIINFENPSYNEITPMIQPSPPFPSPQFPSPQFPSPQFPSPQFPSPQFPSPQFPSPPFPSPPFPSPPFPSPPFPSPPFPSPPFHSTPFVVILNLGDANDKDKKEKEKNFNKTMLKYFHKMVIPSLFSANSKLKYVISTSDILRYFEPQKLPKAYKIYKCNKCLEPSFEASFDFQNINSTKECKYNCLNVKKYNDPYLLTQKFQQLLLSIIDSRLESGKILLKMIVFPPRLIENALSFGLLKILLVILIILTGNSNDYSLIGIFKLSEIIKLLENERFIDLGEIKPSHWAKRAYDSEKVTNLEKEELKQFISITKATFGLIKFKIDKKTIYTLSYIPLSTL